MKSLIKTSSVILAVCLATSSFSLAQDRSNNKARPSPNAEVSQTIGTTVVSLTMGRPGLKGRDIEKMIPDGEVWRTGANESTNITFSGDVKIGDASVEAGTYSLYTLRDKSSSSMTIIINSKLSWGTRYDEAEDVVRTTVPYTMGNHPAEWMAIYFDKLTDTSANMKIHWGEFQAVVPIAVK